MRLGSIDLSKMRRSAAASLPGPRAVSTQRESVHLVTSHGHFPEDGSMSRSAPSVMLLGAENVAGAVGIGCSPRIRLRAEVHDTPAVCAGSMTEPLRVAEHAFGREPRQPPKSRADAAKLGVLDERTKPAS